MRHIAWCYGEDNYINLILADGMHRQHYTLLYMVLCSIEREREAYVQIWIEMLSTSQSLDTNEKERNKRRGGGDPTIIGD